MLQYNGIVFYEHCVRCAARRTKKDALASEVGRGQQALCRTYQLLMQFERVSLVC